MNIILMGSAYILPFLMTPYVSRILLPEGMGKISFATSVLTYFTMFAMLGVPTYGIRAVSYTHLDVYKRQIEFLCEIVSECNDR